MKVSDFIVAQLAAFGLDTCFSVTGGGAMHLNDSFGENKDFNCVYVHHEQAASMAAEGYARISGKPAVVNVTTGPGAINSFNGVFGAYTDSIPMLIIAGQVRSDTISTNHQISNVRQLGDQELRSIMMVKEITKFSHQINEIDEVSSTLLEGIKQSISGRPGPVWIEIPVDIQGANIEADIFYPQAIANKFEKLVEDDAIHNVLLRLRNSKRPLVLAGTGVQIANARNELIEFVEASNIPVVTAWTHDLIESSHRLNAGRAGTIGTRPGNFAVQNCDLLLVIGSRLNIRQVSYNWNSFAENSEIIWIDIDPLEFNKPFVKADLEIISDARLFLKRINTLNKVEDLPSFEEWANWCQDIKAKYEPKLSEYISTDTGINAYHLIPEIFKFAKQNTIFVCGNATACIVPFQVGLLSAGMRMFSNSGSASMGYDLPAAIGAAIADPTRPIVCFAGDGSIMMNIQELQTISNLNLNIKIVILDNDGYLSIKQTQTNFFGHDHGASPKSGVTFPNFELLGNAFDIKTKSLRPGKNWRLDIENLLKEAGPIIIVAPLEVNQEFIPRLKSKSVGGKILTPSLEDMFPHLPETELLEIRNSALKIV
jgi:acetolactate synthase-1/2/3 large subunit